MPEPLIGPKRSLALIVMTLLFLGSACRSDRVFVGMSDSTYVRTMIALRKLPIVSGDSAGRARQRDSILAAFGVTSAQLESTAVRLSRDPERAAAIWRAIENPTTSSPP